MRIPTQLRKPVVFEEGCAQIWPEEEIQEFEKLGDAPSGGHAGQLRIPQHHAYTVEDAFSVINGYRRAAERIGWEFVVRGQTRDYYHESTGRLTALPAIMRPQTLGMYMDYIYVNPAYQEALKPWLGVLENLGIETGTKGVRHPVAVGRTNPVLLAILQHYGFPTDHLDVTTDPIVAVWFALHATKSNDSGKISFKPLRPKRAVKRPKRPRTDDVAALPTVHVVIQPPFRADELGQPFPLVHLNSIAALTSVAQRPVCQSAVSLPCTAAHVSLEDYPLENTVTFRTRSIYRWPSAIIKLYFPFESLGHPEITPQGLFPPDEVLYTRLREAHAPHLAIYA